MQWPANIVVDSAVIQIPPKYPTLYKK